MIPRLTAALEGVASVQGGAAPPEAAGRRLAVQDMLQWLDHAIRRHDQERQDGTRLVVKDPVTRKAKRAQLVEMRDALKARGS